MKKILVIEDDRIMRENTAELLELVGYEVYTATDGKSGVVKALEVMPDLIVCDIKMPELDGYGVLHILQKKTQTATIPFIFLTAKTERADLRKGMEMGADDYLAKPFEDTELLKAVEVRLRKSNQPSTGAAADQNTQGTIDTEAGVLKSLKDTVAGSEQFAYAAKEIIFKRGDHPFYVFYVESGQIKSFQINEEGKEFISNIYNSGDFFGYQAIFEDRPYRETTQALENSQILKLSKEDFLSQVYKNKNIAGKLIKMISKTLTEKESELIHMAYDSVRKRVALKLLEMVPDDEHNPVFISRTDLASLIGTTTETLVRTLTEFKDLDIVDTDHQSIRLIDRKKLSLLIKNW